MSASWRLSITSTRAVCVEKSKDGTHSSRDMFFIILGLEHVYQIIRSSCRQFRLRIDMEDWEGNMYAVYEDFYITDESDGYRLHCGMYSGTYSPIQSS